MRKIVPALQKELNKNFPEINLEELRSDEELFYLCWLSELTEAGYVSNAWYEDHAFQLYTGYDKLYEEKLKTKTVLKREKLIKPTVYTPDFKVEWTEKADGVFYFDYVTDQRVTKKSKPFFHLGEKRVSWVEIKPDHNQNNMTSYAQVKINWLFATQGIYVNLIKIPNFFENNFYPKEYLLTDTKRQPRKQHLTTLEKFLPKV